MAGIAGIIGKSSVFDNNGNQVDLKTHCSGKIVSIYFSANW